jgi:hypothetical protein
MPNRGNRLCKARVKNNNPKSRICEFELVTVREYNDYDGGTYIEQVNTAAEFLEKDSNAVDEPFYHIYGTYCNTISYMKKTRFIAEFFDLDQALNFLLDITGEEPLLISY